ncbi:MAG: tRNA(Ile2) 2-agmatinylcytidine synthetase, partial [Halobacteria archaeon]|nr:tRNA(Ile2) 2-agmatinylcytidine synthetase [Halobacteria archaeon]
LECAAFEPTKSFRDLVRDLRVGDRIEVCGGFKNGTLNVEKFEVRDLNTTELTNPVCDGCGRTMESAGTNQGYRCRDCGTTAPSKVETSIQRQLDEGWYEVPPSARRHIAKPLVRGGFEDVHPER